MRAPRWLKRIAHAARPSPPAADALNDEDKLRLIEWLLRALPDEERAHARGWCSPTSGRRIPCTVSRSRNASNSGRS
jgi:hypothetical protein